MSDKDRRNRSLVEMLHGPLDEPVHASDDEAPNFDGGTREPAPGPSDPVADHDALVLDALRNLPMGGGGQW